MLQPVNIRKHNDRAAEMTADRRAAMAEFSSNDQEQRSSSNQFPEAVSP